MKAVSETEARAQYGDGPTIIRPGLIVGPGDETDRFTYWPVRLSRGSEILAPGDGSDPVQFIDVRSLAEWTIRLAEQRTTGVFNASRPAPSITIQQMLTEIAQGIHADPKIVWAPTSFLKANAVSAWRDMPVWISGQDATFGFHRRDLSRAIAAGLRRRAQGRAAGAARAGEFRPRQQGSVASAHGLRDGPQGSFRYDPSATRTGRCSALFQARYRTGWIRDGVLLSVG